MRSRRLSEQEIVRRSLGDLPVPMKGIRSRGNLVRSPKLVVSIVEFVHWLMVTVGEDGRFWIMGVVVRTRLRAFFRMHQVGDVLGDSVEILFQGTSTALAMLATAGVCFWKGQSLSRVS